VRNHPTPTTDALEAFGNADAPDQAVLEAYLGRVREAREQRETPLSFL
jgi:hypothetical protein